ncbi:MAG: ABC transporter permease [Bacteroidota bacterium]
MLKNTLIAALRAFRRQATYSALNLTGLAAGFAAAFLILYAVQDELRMDQMHSDDLHQVLRTASFDGGATVLTWTVAPQPLAEELRASYPEVEHATMLRYEGEQVVAAGAEKFWVSGFWTDEPFFEMFAFDLLAGDPATVLTQPDGIVVTEGLVQKLFGPEAQPQDAMGQAVRLNDHEARVTGVAADPPAGASMAFEWIAPASEFYARNAWVKDWGNNAMELYVTLRPDADIAALNRTMTDLLLERDDLDVTTAFAQRYSERYLHGAYDNGVLVGGRIDGVRTFSIIAALLLALACINFTNLATARATRRAGEIGVRKSMGATRWSLMRQFLSESVLMALVAFAAAVVLFSLLATPFGTLLDKDLGAVSLPGWMWLGFLGVAVLAGIAAGLYPAVVLSRFSPVKILQGERKGGLALRRSLVVFQFAASVVLIVGTLAVAAQLDFIQTRDIGLDREGLIMAPLRDGATANYDAFRSALVDDPAITNVGTAHSNPLQMGSSTGSVEWRGKDPSVAASFHYMGIDAEAIHALGMEMAAGRAFSAGIASDSSNFIINETAARLMGFEAPVGERITLWEGEGEIVGVVKDFHMRAAGSATSPTIFWLASPRESSWALGFVRTAPGQADAALTRLAAATETFSPAYPLDYRFLDDEYNRIYQDERQLGTMAWWFAGIAMLIATLGLVGLAAYAAEQRRKEIGVRRVLGASVAGLVGLLSRDFLIWVGLACAVAVPVAMLLINRWLAGFAYRVELGVTPFAVAVLGALLLALVTAGSQAVRAATANPVQSLRSE